MSLNRFQEAHDATAELLRRRPDLPNAHRFSVSPWRLWDGATRPWPPCAGRGAGAPRRGYILTLSVALLVLRPLRRSTSAYPAAPREHRPDQTRSFGLLLEAYLAGTRAARGSPSRSSTGRGQAPARRAPARALNEAAKVRLLARGRRSRRSHSPRAPVARPGPLPMAQEALYWKARSQAASGRHEEAARTAAELRRETAGLARAGGRRRLLYLDADLRAARGEKEAAAQGYAEAARLLPVWSSPGPSAPSSRSSATALRSRSWPWDATPRPSATSISSARPARPGSPSHAVRAQLLFLGQIAEKRGDRDAARGHYGSSPLLEGRRPRPRSRGRGAPEEPIAQLAGRLTVLPVPEQVPRFSTARVVAPGRSSG